MITKFLRLISVVLVLFLGTSGLAAGLAQANDSQGAQLNITLKIGEHKATINGVEKELDVAPMLYQNRTLVPIRFVAEAMGADVEYDPAEQAVSIKMVLASSFANVSSDIEVANKIFYTESKEYMEEAAQQAKIKLSDVEPLSVVSIEPGMSKPNINIISAAVENTDSLDIKELAEGADVLFTFLALPEGSEIPSGFYTVNISGDTRLNKWTAQFKDADGKVVLEKPAEVKAVSDASSENLAKVSDDKVKLTVRISPSSIELDLHWSISVKTSIEIGSENINTSGLSEAGQNIIQAGEKFAVALSDSIAQASKIEQINVLSGWMSISNNSDIFTAYTACDGIEDFTSDEIAKGKNTFFGYFRTPEDSGLPTGFYKIQLVRERDQWTAQFIDEKGNAIYKGQANVEEAIEKTAKKGKTFTGSVNVTDENVSITADVHIGKLNIEITITWKK